MTVYVTEQEDISFFLQLCDCFFQVEDCRVKDLGRLVPLSVQINSCNTRSVIPTGHAIRVQNGDKFEYEKFPEILGLVREDKFEKPVKHKRSYWFSRMDPGRYEDCLSLAHRILLIGESSNRQNRALEATESMAENLPLIRVVFLLIDEFDHGFFMIFIWFLRGSHYSSTVSNLLLL